MIQYNNSSNIVGLDKIFTLPYTHTGNNGFLVVSINLIPVNWQSVISVKYNGIDLTLKGVSQVNTHAYHELWYMKNPPEGTFNIEIELTSEADTICEAISFTGVNQIDPIYYYTNMAGNMVSDIPMSIQGIEGGVVLGIGTAYGDAYTTPDQYQTEVWNTLKSDILRTQGILNYPPYTGQIDIVNKVNKPAEWLVNILTLKAE